MSEFESRNLDNNDLVTSAGTMFQLLPIMVVMLLVVTILSGGKWVANNPDTAIEYTVKGVWYGNEIREMLGL